MNARLFLLVLVAGLFMAAWNGDQNAMQAALARRDQARSSAIMVARLSDDAVHSDGAPLQAWQDGVDVVRCGPAADAGSVPLPPGIAAGMYRAVSQTGVVQEVAVEAELAPADGNHSVRDFYISDSASGIRWYLIRIR